MSVGQTFSKRGFAALVPSRMVEETYEKRKMPVKNRARPGFQTSGGRVLPVIQTMRLQVRASVNVLPNLLAAPVQTLDPNSMRVTGYTYRKISWISFLFLGSVTQYIVSSTAPTDSQFIKTLTRLIYYIYKTLRYVSVQGSAVSRLQERNRTY
jgi:hypothetical protein